MVFPSNDAVRSVLTNKETISDRFRGLRSEIMRGCAAWSGESALMRDAWGKLLKAGCRDLRRVWPEIAILPTTSPLGQLLVKGELLPAWCRGFPVAAFSTSEFRLAEGESTSDNQSASLAPAPKGHWSINMTPTVRVRGTVADPTSDVQSPRKPLSLWPGMYNSPVTTALWNARSTIFERTVSWDHDGPAQSNLMTKTPEQSRTSVRYPFSTDVALREQYRSPWNFCRIGKLLEDLDALAGTIAVRHCSDEDMTTRPLLLVTASVDKISIKKELSLDSDLVLAGVAAWTGRSSMEIRMTVIQPVAEDGASTVENFALTANFTFVARDSKTRKAAPINHLAPQTESEKRLFEEGEARDAKRKGDRQLQLESGCKEKVLKDSERLQALLTEGRVLYEMPALADRNSILIRDTSLENTIICQPQQRNLHGRIFGGFLMCSAYELAYSACYVFVGRRPEFQEVDHVDFHRPVDVGDLLRFKSRVLYTETYNRVKPLIHVEVVAVVTQPELRTSLISNTFYFTFTAQVDESTPPVRRVLPATEEEARSVLMRYDADRPVA